MRAQNLVRVLDGAKILLGAGQDFRHVGHQAVAVFAVGAVEFLDGIEVAQVPPVKHQVVAAPHAGNAVDRKADPLVQAHAGVEHQERKDHAVDQRPGDQVLRPVFYQPAQHAGLELAVRVPGGLFKLDALALDLEEHPAFLLVNRRAQFGFKRGHL